MQRMVQTLQQTLQPDVGLRKAAEETIREFEKHPGWICTFIVNFLCFRLCSHVASVGV